MSTLAPDLQQRVAQAIAAHGLLPRGQRVILALSGGRDSVCMAGLLHALLPWGGWRLMAVHFDHGLRGSVAAQADLECCRELCDRLQLPLHTEALQVALTPGESLETAARNARLRAFRRLARQWQVHHVATAHHADDRVETLLFRLIRGTGVRGLPGIAWRRADVLITPAEAPAAAAAAAAAPPPPVPGSAPLMFHRPLLGLWRMEITEYCRAQNLRWVDDATNDSDAHTRNRIRKSLLPRFDELNEAARQHLWNLSEDAANWLPAETAGSEDARASTTPVPLTPYDDLADPASAPALIPDLPDTFQAEDPQVPRPEHFPFQALPWTCDGATLLALGRGRAIDTLQRLLELARRLERAPGAPTRRHYDLLWAMLTDPTAPAALDLPARFRIRRVGTPPHARLTIDRAPGL